MIEQAELRQWLRAIQRVCGLHVVYQELGAWLDLRQEQGRGSTCELGGGEVARPAFRQCFVALLSSRQLMCCDSEFTPVASGALDMHSVVAVSSVHLPDAPQDTCLEVRAPAGP